MGKNSSGTSLSASDASVVVADLETLTHCLFIHERHKSAPMHREITTIRSFVHVLFLFLQNSHYPQELVNRHLYLWRLQRSFTQEEHVHFGVVSCACLAELHYILSEASPEEQSRTCTGADMGHVSGVGILANPMGWYTICFGGTHSFQPVVGAFSAIDITGEKISQEIPANAPRHPNTKWERKGK